MSIEEDDRDRTPWISVKISLPTNHKIMKFKKALGLSGRHEAIGVLVDFWTKVFINSWQTGDMSAWDHEHIEEMLGWTGEPGAVIKALRVAGFIEPDGVKVHDWLKVQKPAIRNRLRYAEEKGRRPTYTGPVDDSLAVRERTRLFNKQLEK